jgi:PqqD family protein of HPr-rel-A system
LSWRLADHLKMQEWDGQMVVYDHYSGDTHCLDRPLALVFSAIVAAPGSSEELTDRLASALGDTQEARAESVRIATEELERLRLVIPA